MCFMTDDIANIELNKRDQGIMMNESIKSSKISMESFLGVFHFWSITNRFGIKYLSARLSSGEFRSLKSNFAYINFSLNFATPVEKWKILFSSVYLWIWILFYRFVIYRVCMGLKFNPLRCPWCHFAEILFNFSHAPLEDSIVNDREKLHFKWLGVRDRFAFEYR